MNAFRFLTHKRKSSGKFLTTPISALVIFGIIGLTGCTSATSTNPSPGTNPQTNSPENLDETVSQKNASRSAKTYLDLAGFSRSGLIKQLMFEGYSKQEAEFGASANGL